MPWAKHASIGAVRTSMQATGIVPQPVSDAQLTSADSGANAIGEPALEPSSGWWVYMLRCVDGTLYTGCTSSLTRRLTAHARGSAKYTRSRLPVVLVYSESVSDRSAALRREAALKRLPRPQKLALCGMTDG
jgi:putative endonuclease